MLPSGLFARIERFAIRRHVVVFGVTAALVGVSAWVGSRLHLDTDILSMVPADNREIDVFKRSLRDFGSLDFLMILIAAPEDGPVEQGGTSAEDYEDLADGIAARLAVMPGIDYVDYRLDETSPLFTNLSQNALLLLGPDRLGQVRPLFEPGRIRRQVQELREKIETQPSFLVKLQAARDPLGLFGVLYDVFLKNRGAFRIDLMDGYYLSSDRKCLLLMAKPNRPPQDVEFSHRLITQVTGEEQAALESLRAGLEPGGQDPFAGIRIAHGGGYMIAVDDSDLIKADIWWNALVSFFLVTGLYLFCYRRVVAIAYSSIPLGVGQVLTFGVAWLCLSGLNSATSGFSAMLMGLGTDFTIVMYGRYIEERRAGRTMEEGISRIMGETALGVATGALTSAGTFYTLGVTQFPGLREFGFLIGTGILICGVTVLLLLPAMIAYVEGATTSRLANLFAFLVFPILPLPLLRWIERRRLVRHGRERRLYLHSFGIEHLMRFAARWPLGTLCASVLICLACGVAGLGIEFSENIKDMRSSFNRGVLVQEEIARRFGGSLNYMIVMCHGRTLDEALARNRGVADVLDRYAADGTIQGYESLLTFLPPASSQRVLIETLAPGSPGAFDHDAISRTFRAALKESGFRAGAYDDYLAGLRSLLRPEKVLTIDDLEELRLGDLVTRYHRTSGEESVTATYVFPRQGIPTADLESMARAIAGGVPEVEVTGVALVGSELRRLFRRDAIRALLLGLVIVGVLLYVDFRKLSLTLFALVQLAGGVLIMLGGMRLAGIRMNFVNAFATTMILGVGVDYGIHVIHRLLRSGRPDDEGGLETGKAVAMAALTNVAGFGTVALSNYPGLRGVGLVCLLGTVGCLFTSLTLLPALMVLRSSRRREPISGP
jgi:hypothetical protein